MANLKSFKQFLPSNTALCYSTMVHNTASQNCLERQINFLLISFIKLQCAFPVSELLLYKQFHLAKKTSVNFNSGSGKAWGGILIRRYVKADLPLTS